MGEQVVQEQFARHAISRFDRLYMGEQVVQEQFEMLRHRLFERLYMGEQVVQEQLNTGGYSEQWGLGLNRFLFLPEFS